MKKRLLWYVCLALMLAIAGVAVLQAAGKANDRHVADKPSPSSLSLKNPAAMNKSLAVPEQRLAQPEPALPRAKYDAAGRTNPETPVITTPSAEELRKAEAIRAYENWQRTGTATPSEKALMNEVIFAQQSRHEGNSLDNHGGPDPQGYRYVDNISPDTATYNWIEIEGTAGATSIWSSSQDDNVVTVPMGMSFPFYGSNYTTASVSSNGNIQFGTTSTAYSNGCLPSSSFAAALLPYWDDLSVAGGTGRGTGWYKYFSAENYFVVEWDSISVLSDGRATFEAILYPSGAAKFQYKLLTNTYTSYTVGVQGSGTGLNFMQYVCNGTGGPTLDVNRAIWFYSAPALNHDFACTGITSPSTSAHYAPGTTVSVTASFANVGSTTESSPVSYQFNGGPVQTGATDVLAHNATQTYTFPVQLTLPATTGDYQLLVWSSDPNDGDHTNDTVRITIHDVLGEDCATPRVISSIPYDEVGQTTCGWADNYNATCLGYYDNGPDVIYQLTLPQDTIITITVYGIGNTGGSPWTGVLLTNHCPPDSNCIAFATMLGVGNCVIPCTHLTAGTYYIMVDNYAPGPDCINYDLHVRYCAPCPVTPPQGAIFETENNDTCEVANPISIGDFVYGTVTSTPTLRDVDWYRVVLTRPDTIVWSVQPSDFQANAFIATGTCGVNEYVAFTSTSVATCSTATVKSGCLVPGTYWVGVSPVFATITNPLGYLGHLTVSQCDYPVGRCCYGNPQVPSCLDTTNYRCVALNGIWSSTLSCATSACPIRPVNDMCADVTPVSLPATFTGNVNNATRDCNSIYSGTGEVWHAFTLTGCSNVTLDFCNTNAAWNSFWTALFTSCPCGTSISSSSYNSTECANGNYTIHWNALPAGTYYYPVLFDPSNADTGAYSITANAVPCPPPPANDACVNAIAITGPVTGLVWNNQSANSTPDNTGCTLGAMSKDVWYCWTTTCEVDVNVTTCGSTFDTKLAVFNTDAACTCPSPTAVPFVCNDDTCGLQSAVSFHAMPGKYMIQAGSFGTNPGGPAVLNIYTSAPCTCDSATAVTVYADPNLAGHEWLHFNAPSTAGVYKIYTSTNKNNDGDPRNNDPNFTLAGRIIATTAGAQIWEDTASVAAYKNYVVVHDCSPTGRCCYGDVMNPSCAVTTRAECDALVGNWTANTDCSSPCPVPHLARCCYGDPTAPQCATNAHFQCNALGGTWDSLMTCEANPCPIRPANDDCSGAIVLTGSGDYNGDNTAANQTATPTAGCGSGGYYDMWYVFTPANGGSDTVRTCLNTAFDTIVDVFSGTCGNLTTVGCNDDLSTCGTGRQSQVVWTATPSTTYYIRVLSYYNSAGNQGPFTLTLVAQ